MNNKRQRTYNDIYSDILELDNSNMFLTLLDNIKLFRMHRINSFIINISALNIIHSDINKVIELLIKYDMCDIYYSKYPIKLMNNIFNKSFFTVFLLEKKGSINIDIMDKIKYDKEYIVYGLNNNIYIKKNDE